MITVAHSHILNYLLDLIEKMITERESRRIQLILCNLLFTIISKNYDYTRKEVCIKWYLELCHKIGIHELAKL